MKVALLGSIPKGDKVRKDWVDWKTAYTDALIKSIPQATVMHGDAISDSAGSEIVVGHDLALIKRADVCIVDAREKLGAGTAQEIVIAKYFKKPVVIVIPKNTHHRKTNITFHDVTIEDWIHPFLDVSTDYVADSIEDAIRWVSDYETSGKTLSVKDFSEFERVIGVYEQSTP